MRTDRAVRRPSSEPVAVRPIVDRQTPVKTLPSLAVIHCNRKKYWDREVDSILINLQFVQGWNTCTLNNNTETSSNDTSTTNGDLFLKHFVLFNIITPGKNM